MEAKSDFQRNKRRYCFTQQSHWAISCCKRLEGKQITSIGKSVWTNALKNLPRTLKRGKHTEADPESQTVASVLGRDTCYQR